MTSPLRPVRRLRSALVALTLTAATAGTALAVAAPAHADNEACTTATSMLVNGKTANKQVVQFGDYVSLNVTVKATCASGSPTFPASGRLRVAKSTDGKHWTVIKTLASPTTIPSGTYISGKNLVTRNTYFQAAYDNGTDASANAWNDTFASSYTAVKTVGIYRKSNEKSSHCGRAACRDTIKVSPVASIKNLKVQIQRKKGSKWKNVGKVKVNAKGAYTYSFKAGQTRVVYPAARGFLSSYYVMKVTRFRATHARDAVR